MRFVSWLCPFVLQMTKGPHRRPGAPPALPEPPVSLGVQLPLCPPSSPLHRPKRERHSFSVDLAPSVFIVLQNIEGSAKRDSQLMAGRRLAHSLQMPFLPPSLPDTLPSPAERPAGPTHSPAASPPGPSLSLPPSTQALAKTSDLTL